MKELLLAGKIVLPGYQKFKEVIGDDVITASHMFEAMWHNYLKDKGSISLPYWSDKFTNKQSLNIVLKSLAKAGWIETHAIPERNWAEASIVEDKLLEYVTPNQLDSIRAHNKFKKYILGRDIATIDNKVSINGKTKHTGLVRQGFMLSGNVEYKYDVVKLAEYRDAIQLNLTKSMDKMKDIYEEFKSDRATYDTISTEILDYYLNTDYTMSNGQNKIDSRGRNIAGNLDKVGGYIQVKDMRASLVIV